MVPAMFPVLRSMVDADGKKGRAFLFARPVNPLMLRQVSGILAGRVDNYRQALHGRRSGEDVSQFREECAAAADLDIFTFGAIAPKSR